MTDSATKTHAFDDETAARAVVKVLGENGWIASALAAAFLAKREGLDDEAAARLIYERGGTLRHARELVQQFGSKGYLAALTPRKKTGSAENPVTKLFPAVITERRFQEHLDALCEARPGLAYSDDRYSHHTLVDFTLSEDDQELPINVKGAGTRFEKALQLCGVEPDDCVPIPAYKANAAVETVPMLIYAISVDYPLVGNLSVLLPTLLTADERIVWELLNAYTGTQVRKAEDQFVFATVTKHWQHIEAVTSGNPFHGISARKSIRILQTKPERTPGIGLRAWGTGASAEVNIHISLSNDATPWSKVASRLVEGGIPDIAGAINRRRTEEVYDPEI